MRRGAHLKTALITMVKSKRNKRRFFTGAVRNKTEGKGDFSLLPARAIRELAIHFQDGAKEHEPRNWEKGISLSVYLDSGLRHGFQILEGKHNERHDRAAAWNFMCFLDTAERIRDGILPKKLDDIGWLKSIKH